VKVEIVYQTQYAYREPVSLSPHLYRLFPRAERHLSIQRAHFQTNLDATVHFRRDLFDNEIASCFYPEPTALLAIELHLALTVEEKNAFAFILAPHAVELPFTYEPGEEELLAPYLARAELDELPFWSMPPLPQPTVPTLTALNRALYDHITYVRRERGAPQDPAETARSRQGACRDFAVLMAACLRRLGVAARLVSGYLFEAPGTDRRAEGSLHAWTEAYLPGAGWVGFDPTNGILCNHHHISTAVGLTPRDIAPVVGRYFHARTVPAQMSSMLQIREIA
jgi:transglutaminase-like putative cysteine protease